jgi:hypothetical protein
MPRAVIVDADTTELRVTLQAGCRPALPEAVTLMITRADAMCQELPLACDDPCRREDRPAEVPARPPAKVYRAVRIEPGLAVFVVDHDLVEAPEGWYLGRVCADACEVAELMIWVRNC